MKTQARYSASNSGKGDFRRLYNRPDARTYFQGLQRVDYSIPEAARPLFRGLLDDLKAAREGEDLTALDLGCSYGVNAALMKYDLTLDSLYDYHDDGNERPFDEAVQQDRRYFDRRASDGNLSVVGLDAADRAVEYGIATGLLDDGIAADLEVSPLSDDDADKVKGCDLVTSTGCVGYVTDRTFSRLLPHLVEGTRPWFANFVLRMFPYEPITEVLADAGFVTRKLDGVLFPQRRFVDTEERDHAADAIRGLGLDPEPELESDCYYAEFFFSTPRDEAGLVPVESLASRADRSTSVRH